MQQLSKEPSPTENRRLRSTDPGIKEGANFETILTGETSGRGSDGNIKEDRLERALYINKDRSTINGDHFTVSSSNYRFLDI